MEITMFAAASPTPTFGQRVAPSPPAAGRYHHSLNRRLADVSSKKLSTREHLFLDGDQKTHVYQVEAGTLLIYKILPDAKRQVVDIAFPGDFVGLGTDAEHAFSAQATEPARVRCIPVALLRQLAAEDPALALELYEAVALELEAARNHLMTLGYRSAAGRVASFLLALSRRSERRGREASEMVLPMRRADIADFLGLTIETVSRTFSRLKSDGIIDLDHGGYVAIKNREALADVAEGERQCA
ncbi:MAG: helix-turn-helix domain-containing protein [Hyphomicrobiaceae bacterium]